MQKIYLYQGRGKNRKVSDTFVLVDDGDYNTLNRHEWGLMKIYHGGCDIFYARRYEGKKGSLRAILMHRYILGLNTKQEKGDHIDGNGLNNQRSNLRVATHSQNMSNRKSSGSSRYLGVYFDTAKRRWAVSTRHNNINHKSGYFISEDIAALKYNEMAFNLKGEFAKMNVIRWF